MIQHHIFRIHRCHLAKTIANTLTSNHFKPILVVNSPMCSTVAGLLSSCAWVPVQYLMWLDNFGEDCLVGIQLLSCNCACLETEINYFSDRQDVLTVFSIVRDAKLGVFTTSDHRAYYWIDLSMTPVTVVIRQLCVV